MTDTQYLVLSWSDLLNTSKGGMVEELRQNTKRDIFGIPNISQVSVEQTDEEPFHVIDEVSIIDSSHITNELDVQKDSKETNVTSN